MNTVFLLVLHVFNKHSFGAFSSASLMTESLKRSFPRELLEKEGDTHTVNVMPSTQTKLAMSLYFQAE